jgi:predicted porin
MNAKRVAVALASIACSPLAAQAQLANVTLYGSLNLDVEWVKGATCPSAVPPPANNNCSGDDPASQISNPTVMRVSSNSSRFGLRGSEYLGAGQVAIFQLESSVQGDTGNSSSSGLASRETFVGLQGDWGTFKGGKFLTPYDDMLPIFGNAPTLTTSILSTAAVWAQGPLPKSLGGFDARLGNSLRYETPPLNGFTAELQFSTRDSSGNANGGDNGDHASETRHASVWSVGAFYSNGPLDLGFAYEYNYQVRTADQNDRALSIAAAYDIGSLFGSPGLRLGGVYERLNYGTLAGSLIRDFWALSATVPIGGGSLYAMWGRASNGKGDAPDGTGVGFVVKGPDTGCDQWEISYSYPLSLRTLLYAGYVRINNRANAAYTFNINDYAVVNGARPSGAVFGITHFF